MSLFDKNLDHSYESAKYDENIEYSDIVLMRLISHHLNIKRVNTNRKWVKCELLDDKYISYIKYWITSNNINVYTLKQYYLYSCANFRGDYFNSLNPLNYLSTFMENVSATTQLPLPSDQYFGNDYHICSHMGYKSQSEWHNPDHLIPYNMSFSVDNIRVSSYDGIWVRDEKSPCPGVVHGYPFRMNIKTFKDRKAIFKINSFLRNSNVTKLCADLKIPVPEDNKVCGINILDIKNING